MIFIGFLLIMGIFLLFSFISGNIFHFINIDSFLIILSAPLIFTIFTLKWKAFVTGLHTMFAFKKSQMKKNEQAANHYKSMMVICLATGVVSTCQGIYSYLLSLRDGVEFALNTPFYEAFCYAAFTTVYAVILSCFLIYPTYLNCRD